MVSACSIPIHPNKLHYFSQILRLYLAHSVYPWPCKNRSLSTPRIMDWTWQRLSWWKPLYLTVVLFRYFHFFCQGHLFCALENGCAFSPGNSSSKHCCSFLSPGFMDNWKVSMSVGISTAAVDSLSCTTGKSALISKETNLHYSSDKWIWIVTVHHEMTNTLIKSSFSCMDPNYPENRARFQTGRHSVPKMTTIWHARIKIK